MTVTSIEIGDPTAHAHDWVATGEADEAGTQPIACAIAGCGATGYGQGDFSEAARELRRNHVPTTWQPAGPPDANGVHPIVNAQGETNTCDCHAPREDGGVSPDPGHEVTALTSTTPPTAPPLAPPPPVAPPPTT